MKHTPDRRRDVPTSRACKFVHARGRNVTPSGVHFAHAVLSRENGFRDPIVYYRLTSPLQTFAEELSAMHAMQCNANRYFTEPRCTRPPKSYRTFTCTSLAVIR